MYAGIPSTYARQKLLVCGFLQGKVTLVVRMTGFVLVLEDQPLIALEVEELLNSAGFPDVITYSSCAQATEWLAENTPTLAVIETRLRDGFTIEVAQTLASRNVPIIVHSADDMQVLSDSELQWKSRSWINKPSWPDVFLKAVMDCRTPG
jgi:DNA-binding response OmpR family regulator